MQGLCEQKDRSAGDCPTCRQRHPKFRRAQKNWRRPTRGGTLVAGAAAGDGEAVCVTQCHDQSRISGTVATSTAACDATPHNESQANGTAATAPARELRVGETTCTNPTEQSHGGTCAVRGASGQLHASEHDSDARTAHDQHEESDARIAQQAGDARSGQQLGVLRQDEASDARSAHDQLPPERSAAQPASGIVPDTDTRSSPGAPPTALPASYISESASTAPSASPPVCVARGDSLAPDAVAVDTARSIPRAAPQPAGVPRQARGAAAPHQLVSRLDLTRLTLKQGCVSLQLTTQIKHILLHGRKLVGTTLGTTLG